MDESTDIAVHKKLAVCVRYVDDGNMVTKLLTNVKTKSATAASIVSAVRDLCHTFEFHMDKLVGFGSDGASVMTGKGSGVAVRLRRDLPPHLVAVCLAHRLSLACSAAAGDVRYVADFKSNINKLYAHFSAAANRQAKLEAMYEVLGGPAVKLKSNTDIRWLSLNNAIQAIYRTYRSVVETLNEEAQETKNAKTLGLHSFMTTFMFCTFLCLLVDVLNILTKLCKTMQYRDLLYAYVKPKIALAVGEIKGMKNVSGPLAKGF